MNKWIQIVKKSFSLRMSLYILMVASSVFLLAFWIYFQQARQSVSEEAVDQAQVKLENTILQIDQVLNSVETAVKNLSWLVADKLDNPDYMYEITQQLLRSNPHVVGSAIAFEPLYYPEKGVLYSPYSYLTEKGIESKQLGTEDYEYHYMDWYLIPKLLGKPYWSEPYFDEGGADLVMTTFSLPLYDAEGKMYAVFTADISLEWFAEKVAEIKSYPNSFNYMIGRGGTYLVSVRKEAILNETFFARALMEGDANLLETGHRMVNGESGMTRFNRNDVEYYLFYAPVKATGWSVFVACPYNEVFAGINGLRNRVLVVLVLGLLLLTGFCYYIIRRLVKPLESFAGSADEIAKGNFQVSLPLIKSEDEMKTLRDSFESMQHSLVTYIDELKRTTASKERIESELRIARDIQMGMVPKIFPPFPEREDVDLFAKLIPAKEVGGDLYDFFVEDDKFYFMVGDVSGKGVPASLVMAVTCRLFRTVAAHFRTPAEIVSALNDTLAENNDSNMFCTAFLGILDLKTGQMQYCNAGHNAPVVMDEDGSATFMEVVPNLPLGLFGGFPYEGQECEVNRGSKLFLYTDGVTEAESVDKVLYSDERLLELLANCRNEHVDEVVEKVLEDIASHSAGAEQSDDITVMCINYKQMNDGKEIASTE